MELFTVMIWLLYLTSLFGCDVQYSKIETGNL